MEPLFPPPPRPYSPYAPVRKRAAPRHPWQERTELEVGPRTPTECDAEIERIGRQLARIVQEIPWGRVQNDAWDGRCQFIFRLRTVDRVRVRAEEIARQQALNPDAFVSYALRRWYCFWGARMAELLFLRHPNVLPGPPRDHEVDFTIDLVPFDLKTTELPRAFAGRLDDLVENQVRAATWFYEHQSRERRFHAANRLFLVLGDPEYPDEAWHLRADVAALRAAIDAFLGNPRYVDLTVADRDGIPRRVVSAIIPVRPLPVPRQLRLDLDRGGSRHPNPPRSRGDARRGLQLGLPFDRDPNR